METKNTKKLNIGYPYIIITGIILTIVYGVRAFSTDYYVDSEILNTKEYLYNWDSIGRFGLIFIKKLSGLDWINPFMEAVLFTVMLSVTACTLMSFVRYIASDIDDAYLMLFALLSLIYPTYGEQFLFRFQSFEVILAVELVIVSCFLLVRFLENKKLWVFLITVPMLVISFGVYQSMVNLVLLFYAGTVILLALRRDGKFIGKGFLYASIQFGVSLILYLLIDKLFFQSGTYLAGKMGWKGLGAKTSIQNIIEYGKDVLKARNPYYTYVFDIILAVFLITLIVDLIFYEKKLGINRLYIAIGAVILVSSPFFLCFVQGMKTDFRAQIMLPFSIGFMWIYSVRFWNSNKLLAKMKNRSVLIFAVGIVMLLMNLSNLERLFYSESVVADSDKTLANSLIYDIEKMDSDKRVVFIGRRDPNINESCYSTKDVISYQVVSVYLLDCDPAPEYYFSTNRILSFFETLGHVFNRPTTEDMNEAYEMAENMPVYPKEGSIKESDNLIVIKIGETKID